MLLLKHSPHLENEWDFDKNILDIDSITHGSHKKAWWICKRNTNHCWKADISSRVAGNGCPYCNGKKVLKENSLLITHPNIIKEWDFNKNCSKPDEISYGSSKKIWWICDKKHSWKAVINNRVLGNSKCPYCSNKKVYDDNNLSSLYPEIAREWDYIKNIISPKEVLSGTGKMFWWVCDNKHSWKASVKDRVKGRGCPYCSNKKVCKDNCLKNVYPEIAKEWHPTRNKTLTPEDVVFGSHKKVWWKCSNKNHKSWKARVVDRKRFHCPSCSIKVSKISQKWLDSLNILQQNREISIVIDSKRYFVDGFCPKTNTIYEFYGDFWHGNPKIYNLDDINKVNKKSYRDLLKNTMIREFILKSAGYKIVSIWEKDFKIYLEKFND